MFALDFPPISHLVEWPAIFLKGTPLAVNKVVLLTWLTAILVFAFFYTASRQQRLVPKGVQNLAESTVEFIRDEVILQTMGAEGLYWTPYLLTLFTFVFVCNIWEVIPIAQMPVTARFAVPMFLALVTWVAFIFIGIKRQGLGGYFKQMMFPPGVPKVLYVLIAPIELISTVIVRPFSLMLRLFANLLAGHLLLITFSLLTATLIKPANFTIGGILPFAMLVALLGFEVLIAVLQAYIFTILTGAYLQTSMSTEH